MKTIVKISIGAAALALTAGGVAMAQQGDRRSMSADANNDGNVTRAEAQAAATARFARMDANDDGRLTSEDRGAARERRHGEMFTAMDSDRNGSISRAEWDAHHARMAERRAARADDDDDRREHRGRGRGRDDMHGRAGGEDRGMSMMRRADTNNDNAVDRAEFLAAAESRFQRADANNDGTISAAERQAMRERMGERRQERRERRGDDDRRSTPSPATGTN
ncbi:hypothetical protein GV829_13035 [Sphingomonas lacunae]|uniref:EF-hand domain-containing protein n=1 Tax=Sphingomonas lacunae TaxID=2698828 RepID=A0A6M4AVS2_9SPHN|nr:EF-hand domain-containing protein [Sphingomonas lacunae]QJQ33247.1 hypothetical protein GV829_13035 [Sphingomonas lacunae]